MNAFQRAAESNVESDPRVTEIRSIERKLRNAKQEVEDLQAGLRESLTEFYPLFRSAEKLEIDPRNLTKMIRNGAIFGLKVDGKWYAEKIEIDDRAEQI